jgi:tetratricopeptide (TPR) repeat protein
MLFDLQGKRRRLVQATYLTLAVLMGGGLVLFGIGGDVTGGLLSEGGIFSGDGGSSQAEKEQDERLREAQADLRSNPQNAEALATVVQVHFNKATGERDEATGAFNARGRSELFAATDAWQRYLATNPDPPTADVAELMTDIYALTGQYKKAQQSAQIVADQNPSVDAFLALAQYATYAKDKRTARRAGDKAIELAADDERKDIEQLVEETLKQKAPPQAPAQPPPGGGGGNVFQEPGQEGQQGGGGAPPGGGGQPPSGNR